MLFAASASAVEIAEIRIDQPSTDVDEFFELRGTASESLNDLTYIVLGDSPSGKIESVTSLAGMSIPAGGNFLCSENSPLPNVPAGAGGTVSADLVATLGFENGDNVTHMLVRNFTGALGDTLDMDQDGIIDVPEPWSEIVDCVALIETIGSGDLVYCATQVGPSGIFVPAHTYKCPDTGAWVIGEFDPSVGVDTPRAENPSCANPPPSVLDQTRVPCVPLTGEAAAITAAVLGATSADVTYTIDGGAGTTLAMTLDSTSGDTSFFSQTIPSQGVNATLVEYLVTAYNANPDTSLGFGQGYFVGTVNIGDVRVNNATGNNIYEFYGARIVGNVTAANGTYNTTGVDGYIQDATGGIKLFEFDPNSAWSGANLGDEVRATGTLDQFNFEMELTSGGACDSLFIEVLGPGAVPAPKDIFPCDVGEENEGLLATMFFAQLDTAGLSGGFLPNDNVPVTNCTASTVNMFIDSATNIPTTAVLSEQYEVTGIVGQFGGYQIKPRNLGDLTPVNVTVGVGDDRQVGRMGLLQNSPNPFSRSTEIRFQVPAAAAAGDQVEVQLEVFDVRGRRVAVLVDELLESGEHVVTLSGRDLGEVASGVYFYRLSIGDEMLTRKLILQK